MSTGARREFGRPGHFTVGTIGEPGHRVFYLQVFGDGEELSVKCEKQQAQALALQLERLLDELPGGAGRSTGVVHPAEALPPTELAWVVGTVRIGVDAEGQVIVLLEELLFDEDGDPVEGEGASASMALSPDQVRAFAAQVGVLVAGGRPICRLCDQPIDPEGHACPRLN